MAHCADPNQRAVGRPIGRATVLHRGGPEHAAKHSGRRQRAPLYWGPDFRSRPRAEEVMDNGTGVSRCPDQVTPPPGLGVHHGPGRSRCPRAGRQVEFGPRARCQSTHAAGNAHHPVWGLATVVT